MSDQKMADLFFEFFAGLAQQGPGSDESTRRAWALLGDLPLQPEVIDIGCGVGRQTLELARLSGGRVTAVDLHQTFLARLDITAREAGLEEQIRTLIDDMGDLGLPDQSFDVIWSEGAISNVGFEAGLKHWHRLVSPGGWVVVTECCWLTAEPSPECARFWAEEYPEMATVNDCLAMAERAGYVATDHFTLPDSDWEEHYYAPMVPRLAWFRKKHGTSREALAVSNMCENEISVRRRFGSEYGYVCFVLRPTQPGE